MKVYRPDPEGLSDSELLSRLIACDTLEESEVEAFSSMAIGLYKLSRKQRQWAEAVYMREDLQRHYAANLASKAKKGKKAATPAPWHPLDEALAVRPLKPPGR